MAIFDVSFLNPSELHKDAETGCVYFGSNKDSTYEVCRQSFYLKSQNEILKQNSQQKQEVPPVNNEQQIKELETQNINLQEIINQQNIYKIENSNLINIILSIVLLAIVCGFLIIKLKLSRKSRNKNFNF